jgi:plastocyanin
MRRSVRLGAAAAIAAFLAVVGAPPALGAQKPVKISGSVNVHGAADVSGETDAELAVALDNFFISPTYTKAAPGQTITVAIENKGSTTHTFTSDALGVDEQLAPGAKKTVEITVPDANGAYRVYCRFHETSGMKAAVYTKKGAKATDKAPKDASGS